VLQGTSDDVLNAAVGHVPASLWPGTSGTTILAAHDVTWFSRIDRLGTGDQIRYVTPCRTFLYQVTSHQVVQAGSPVYNTVAGRIVLDTRYPLDALYITSLRYLVYADLVETAPTAPMHVPAAAPPPLTVPAPAALSAQGLGLEQNDAPLGYAHLGWLAVARVASDECAAPGRGGRAHRVFRHHRSAGQDEQGWWRDLAPSVPQSAAEGIWGGQITSYDTRLRITLRVMGHRVLGAQLTAAISTAGSWRPGTYDLTVTETVTGQHRLVVSGVTMRAG
jgi:LPXTG-site transpeptidase (sortase) family protein